VKIIVPFGVGGPADIYARFVGARLSDAMGQPFVVENRPGAGAVVGSDAVAKSTPDGYTLLMMSNTHTVNETLIPKKPYELMRDLAPINGVNYSDLLMVIHPSVPANNLKEFLALAKAKPKELNYASSGPGTPYHMAGELFKAMAGVDIVHVPYKGGGPAMSDLLGGQVDASFQNINAVVPHVASGKLRALAVTSAQRSPLLPQVPTLVEAGVKEVDVYSWQAAAAPKGLPADVKAKLHASMIAAMNDPSVKPKLLELGFEIVGDTPEHFSAFQQRESARWKQLIETRKITAD
jgi:tripartite-type tricarboxylate transporter receptor subunit TctC